MPRTLLAVLESHCDLLLCLSPLHAACTSSRTRVEPARGSGTCIDHARAPHPSSLCLWQCFMNIFETEEDAARVNAKALQFVLHIGLTDRASLVEKITGPITKLPEM